MDNPHKMHRQRLKKRFLKEGLRNFEKHNVIELLLFYAIPQQDVNGVAHELHSRFGSISGVLDAPYNELIKIKGIGEHAATYFKLLPELLRVYANEKINGGDVKTDYDSLGIYLVYKYLGVDVETVFAIFLDKNNKFITCDEIYKGSINSVHFNLGDVVKKAYSNNAVNIIIAHNHPGASLTPSEEDIATTRRIFLSLNDLQINLIESYIISGRSYIGLVNDKTPVRVEDLNIFDGH